MPNTKHAIGVDLGGTSIKFGVVSRRGKLIASFSLPTNAQDGPDTVINQIKKGIRTLQKEYKNKIAGIGIGSPGSIIQKKGTVENPPNFPGWEKVPLGKILNKEFGLKVSVDNDANAAAIGEMIFGAGKKDKNFIMITLGTGVGSGIIIDQKIYRGETGAAGEIGHVSIKYDGRKCKCGSYGCVEAYVGNNYLVENVKQELNNHPDSMINKIIENELGNLTPKVIHDAACQGDEYARSIVMEVGKYVGYGLANATNTLDITIFIIGGGVSGFGELLFNSIKEAAVERVMVPFKERIVIKPAHLKNDAGVLGASALVFYDA
ncbi:MAG: ROK family protein [bacterium]